MSVEEKSGFMLINTINMIGSRRAEASENKLAAYQDEQVVTYQAHLYTNEQQFRFYLNDGRNMYFWKGYRN
jgi:hypothetical protein